MEAYRNMEPCTPRIEARWADRRDNGGIQKGFIVLDDDQLKPVGIGPTAAEALKSANYAFCSPMASISG